MEVEEFLKPVRSRAKEEYKEVVFCLRRQRFLEMFDGNFEQEELMHALQDLQVFCSPDVYNSLCMLLNYDNLRECPDFVQWSKFLGR